MTGRSDEPWLEARFPFLYSLFTKTRRDLYLTVFRWRRSSDDPQTVFAYCFERNLFGSAESLSGTGSSLRSTRTLRAELPSLMQDLGVHTVLDIPCGDFHWAKEIDWRAHRYIGADIVPGLIERNRGLYTSEACEFVLCDILRDPLPRCDLVLCRDLFIHFPNERVLEALHNIVRSGARFLLTTHYSHVRLNRDIRMGSFRPINLEAPPFNLPPPDRMIEDNDYLKLWGRTLALWRTEVLSYVGESTLPGPRIAR